MTNPSESETVDGEEEVEVAAKAICAGRSDDWNDPEDQVNAWDDARAALTAAATLRPPREAEGRYREALRKIADDGCAGESWPTPCDGCPACIARQALQEQLSEGNE